MQKLIPLLRDLLIQKKIGEVNISELWVDPYKIGIRVWCTEYRIDGTPSELPFDYDVEISLLNVLTAQSSTDTKKTVPNDYLLLENLRTEIVNAVSRVIFLVEQGTKEGKMLSLEDFLKVDDTAAKQYAVENDYQQRFSLTTKELSALHMFHSPFRIPLGYTEEEVRLCIMLYPIWQAYVRSVPGFYPPTLHPSLFERIDDDISRTEALKNAIFEMYMEIIRHPPPVPLS